MKLEAKSRLLAAEQPPVLELKIQCSNMDTYLTLVNLLGAIQYNCDVGHSAVVGAFFDGDGADKVEIKGLPDNEGSDMAKAASDYNDSLMVQVGPHSAQAYADDNVGGFSRKTVWPEEK